MSSTAASRGVVRRWGVGTVAVVRLLVASDTPLSGVAIAGLVKLSQPRVSQVLSQLSRDQAVMATPRGYIGDTERLLELYRDRVRPSLVEPESYWFSSRGFLEQAQQLVELSRTHEFSVALSADLGVDLLALGHQANVTIAYVSERPRLETIGFMVARGRETASLIVRVTEDSTLFTPTPPWRSEVVGLPLTDPCQQWLDLQELGGEARNQTALRLGQAIMNKTLPRF